MRTSSSNPLHLQSSRSMCLPSLLLTFASRQVEQLSRKSTEKRETRRLAFATSHFLPPLRPASYQDYQDGLTTIFLRAYGGLLLSYRGTLTTQMILFPAATFISTRVMNVTLYRQRSKHPAAGMQMTPQPDSISGRVIKMISRQSGILNSTAEHDEEKGKKREKRVKREPSLHCQLQSKMLHPANAAKMLPFYKPRSTLLTLAERTKILEILIGFR
ncbi:hypothetical protein K0M31_007362 [Melipona bicolor]|uniref:Uncharacterized protein n=1 Tax=Melipona bicolor TaxID=60889 RepID=A0AA40KVL7_9HYME|nr:hypothetical protein K0M31_007362 [Melipona bicolor]